MNKMKKTLMLVLSLAMSATLVVACNDNKGGDKESSTANVENSSLVESEVSEEESSTTQSSEELTSEDTSSEDVSSEESSEEEKQTYNVTFEGDVEGAILSQAFTYQSGDEVEVVIVLDEIYSQSIKTATVSYTVGGGEAVTVTLDEYDSFFVNNANGDIVVTVTGISVNEYKVSFYNGDEEAYFVMVPHGGILTEAQLAEALAAVSNDTQEVWGWQEAVDGMVVRDTSIHALVATAISSAEELATIEQNGNYFLASDIDFTGKEMIKFENEDNRLTGFQGSIDGRGYTITVAGGDVSDEGLLFWRLDNATIKNVTFDVSFNGLAFARAGGLCRQFVDSTLQDVTINASYAQIGQASVIGTFFGGLVKNCKVYVKTPSYNTAMDGIAALAASVEIGDWGVADSVVDGLEVHLPANLTDSKVVVAAYVCSNGADVEGETVYQYTEDNVSYVYDMEEAQACEWENSIITPLLLDVSGEEVPMDYSVVYAGTCRKSVIEGVMDYMWSYEALFGVDKTADISYYRAIRFAIKTNEESGELVLGSDDIGEIGEIGATWSEIVLMRNAQNMWNIYKDGVLAAAKLTVEDMSNVFSRKGIKNSELNSFALYVTNVQVIGKEGVELPKPTVFEGKKVLDNVLKESTLTTNAAPQGYESVYSMDITSNEQMWAFANFDLSPYAELRFKALSEDGATWIGYDGGDRNITISEFKWREIVLTNNNDGTFTVTEVGLRDTFTYETTSLGELFRYVLYNDGGTLYVTELKGVLLTVEPYGEKVASTVVDTNVIGDVTVVEDVVAPSGYETVTRQELVGKNLANGGFADVYILPYSDVRFMVKSDEWLLVDGSWDEGAVIDPTLGVWCEFILTKGEGANWTLQVLKGKKVTYTGDVHGVTLQEVLYKTVGSWLKTTDTTSTIIQVTELRGVKDDNYVPATAWGEEVDLGVVNNATLESNNAPEGYESVYSASTWSLATANVSEYAELRFAMRTNGFFLWKADWSDCTQKRGVWTEFTLVQNEDGTWNITVDYNGKGGDRTLTNVTGSTLAQLLPYTVAASDKDKALLISVTELRGVLGEGTTNPDAPNPDTPNVPSEGEAVLEKVLTNGTLTEQTQSGYNCVYSVTLDSAEKAWVFADFDISNYAEVRFKAHVEGNTTYIGWDAVTCVAITTWEWREVVVTNNGDGTVTVTIVGYNDTFTYESTNLKEIFRYTLYNEGGTLYATELQGTLSEVTPNPGEPDAPVVENSIVSEKILTNSTLTDRTVEGYTSVYQLNLTKNEHMYEFVSFDISKYAEVRFKAISGSSTTYIGYDGGSKYLAIGSSEWREVVITNNGDGSVTVSRAGIDGSYTYESTDLREVLRYIMWNTDAVLYVTELRGVKAETEQATLEKVLKDCTLTDQMQDGYNSVYKMTISSNEQMYAFADFDITGYTEVRFKAHVEGNTTYIGWDAAHCVPATSWDWREIVITNNGDGTVTVTQVGCTDTFTWESTNLTEIFRYTLYNEGGTLYVTELHGVKA